jgi:hypothetical protein
MLSQKFKVFIILALPYILLTGCASSLAPRDWLPETAECDSVSYGGWLYVEYLPDSLIPDNIKSKAEFIPGIVLDSLEEIYDFSEIIHHSEGEYLTSDKNFVYVLSQKGKIDSIYYRQILYAELDICKKYASIYGGVSFLGLLSTISNGWFLIGTAPLWILTGFSTSIGESYRDSYKCREPDIDWWFYYRRFSRFPQGPPRSIGFYKIMPKIN